MLRYKLRTLLILLAVGPPMLAGAWSKYWAWKAERERRAQRIAWMISPLAPPESYSQLPKTVGELEVHMTAAYLGIDGAKSG